MAIFKKKFKKGQKVYVVLSRSHKNVTGNEEYVDPVRVSDIYLEFGIRQGNFVSQGVSPSNLEDFCFCLIGNHNPSPVKFSISRVFGSLKEAREYKDSLERMNLFNLTREVISLREEIKLIKQQGFDLEIERTKLTRDGADGFIRSLEKQRKELIKD